MFVSRCFGVFLCVSCFLAGCSWCLRFLDGVGLICFDVFWDVFFVFVAIFCCLLFVSMFLEGLWLFWRGLGWVVCF